MDSRSSKKHGARAIGTAVALALTFSIVLTGIANADDDRPGRLAGTWSLLVTRTNCETNAPLPGPPIPALLTFARGGTMIDSAGSPPPGFAPSQRSIGLGVWNHTGGRRYQSQTVMLIHFETPANPPAPATLQGWQTLSQDITLLDGDNFTAVASTQFLDLAGHQYRSGCSTAVGRRINAAQ
jgi:hypothetical protein